jgi:hypothetical protein
MKQADKYLLMGIFIGMGATVVFTAVVAAILVIGRAYGGA